MKKWRSRSRGRGLYREHQRSEKLSHDTADKIGLIYADEGETVSSLQDLDLKAVNLKIIVWLPDQDRKDKPTIIAVSRFEGRHSPGVRAVGRDTVKYDLVYVPGRTPLYAYSY